MQNTDKTKRKHGRIKKLEMVRMPKLIEEVAQSCMYEKYEVEDVLRHLAIVMQRNLLNGKEVKIDGVGVFRLTKCKPLKVKHLNTDKEMSVPFFRLGVRRDAWFKEELKFSDTSAIPNATY
jgi:nucleoid DNA-binding protein